MTQINDQLNSMVARHDALQREAIATAAQLRDELDRARASAVITAEELEQALTSQAERLEEQSSQLDDQKAQLRDRCRCRRKRGCTTQIPEDGIFYNSPCKIYDAELWLCGPEPLNS